VRGLEHFSYDIMDADALDPDKRQRLLRIVREMHDAAGVLLKWLPIYQHMPFGIQCPPEVAVVLDALPAIKRDLEPMTKQKIGRRRDVRRELCAETAWFAKNVSTLSIGLTRIETVRFIRFIRFMRFSEENSDAAYS
jgi:hypothetical protein